MAYLPSYGVNMESSGLAYAAGATNAEGYLKNRLPDYYNTGMMMANYLKDNPDKGYTVLDIGMPYVQFYIPDSPYHVERDDMLNTFHYAYANSKDTTDLYNKFKSGGVRYIVVSPTFTSIDSTPDGILKKRSEELSKFLQDNGSKLKVTYSTQTIVLFEIY
jgi:hypothetical protein